MKLNSYLMREAFLSSNWSAALDMLRNDFGINPGYIVPRLHIIRRPAPEQIAVSWDDKRYSWDSEFGFRILPGDNFFSRFHIWSYSSTRRP